MANPRASAVDTSASRWHLSVTIASLGAIIAHVAMRVTAFGPSAMAEGPLVAALVLGGVPLTIQIVRDLVRGDWGADVLAALSIVTAVWLHEYLAGAFIVLMLASGDLLESYAVDHAASVLRALARRMPATAHRRRDGMVEDVPVESIEPGHTLVIFPHEICPVDGVVVEGHATMDESFLTGEPFQISKAPGSTVISGAINGEAALTITASRRPADSRYAKIMEVMRAAEQDRPRLRRLGDRLGALYAPVALALAGAAWMVSGSSQRFLAVLVIATPCPMLIGIPVAILGAVSLAAKRSIIIRRPMALEQAARCRTAVFDKTGTLTYGRPILSEVLCAPGVAREEVLRLAASLERYSRHPLAGAVLAAAEAAHVAPADVLQVSERAGEGLHGVVNGRTVHLTGRSRLTPAQRAALGTALDASGGLECFVFLDGAYAATLRFRDEVRADGRLFVSHLGPRHGLERILLVSGDRDSEVRYLAEQVGITEIYAQQRPEDKLALVRRETERAPTLMVGDGINDAPALMASTVGIAIGQHSDITGEAAGVVIMDNSLKRLDEFLHISLRMRRIALQSAVGGMALSMVGMAAAAGGWLTPVMGAVCQEIIDVLAVFNALRMALPPKVLSDYTASHASS